MASTTQPKEPTFLGTIHCKVCDAALAQAPGVFEWEKASQERKAFHNCRPNCEHAAAEMKAKHGFCFNQEVRWEPEQPDV
jgi:hypothetical protein